MRYYILQKDCNSCTARKKYNFIIKDVLTQIELLSSKININMKNMQNEY